MKKKMRLGTLAMLCVLLLTAASALAECTGDHPFGPWKTKRNPTCRLEGLDFRYCRECDHWEKRYTKKLPHEVEEWTITREPTCTQEGRKEGVCSACKQTVSRRIEMLPHEYGEMTVAVEPTCTQNGKGESFCAVCGHKKTETLAKLGHDWGEVSVTQEPTCAKKGKGEQICARCGKTQTVSIDHLEHVYGEYTVTSQPDGKKKGTRVAACTLCGKERTERFYDEGTLYEDMEPCEAVITMQTQLKDVGYYNGRIRTGKFGEGTTRAVAKFQQANGLKQSGIADPATLEAIQSAWEKLGKAIENE